VKGGGCAPLALPKRGRKYHDDGMYARNWPSPVYVLSSLWLGSAYNEKKENKIFLIYKKIHVGGVA
jgi:hypothetical protein